MVAKFDSGQPDSIMQNLNLVGVSVDAIISNPHQPRKIFALQEIEELSESIREFGVIQPLLLRKNADRFEIIAGERRWRAAKMAGLRVVPAVIRDCEEKEMAELALIENLSLIHI